MKRTMDFDIFGGNGKKRGIFLLVLFFALGMLIRAPGLGRWCLTVDEFYFSKAVSFIMEKGLPMFPGGGYYTRGIGLQYLATLPVSLIGNLEFAVRILPLLFGAMMIPLFFLFCRKFLGEGESILCTIILLLSSWHIELSRFARMYMPFQFLFFLFLYHVHSGFRENDSRQRIVAWVVAALSIVVYEGSVILALLLAALVLTGDAGKTNRNLGLFTALLLALLALNLAANLPAFRSMGVSETGIGGLAIPQRSSALRDLPVVLPDLGWLSFACRSWAGRGILLLLASAGAWLTTRSVRKYDGPFPKVLLLASLLPLTLLPLVHQYGILAILGVLFAMNRRDILLTVRKDLLLWGIYVLVTFVFWMIMAAQSGNLGRIRHFLVAYPNVKDAVLLLFLRDVPLWTILFFGTAAFSILRNILFRKWGEDLFPLTILLLCLAIVPVFRTPYLESRYSFFFFPLFLIVAIGEMRAIRLFLSEKVWPVFGKQAGALLLAIPLALFLLTEDFHLHHVMDVSSADLNFRTGPYRQYATHWYPRFDFKNTGRFVEKKYMDGDVVVLEQVAMSQYLGKPFFVYVPENYKRFKGIARKGGTEEIWSGRPLISHFEQLATKAPGNGHNSLWMIAVVWDFHGGRQKLATKYEDLAREFGLAVDLAYVGIDGRTGVWRVRRGVAGKDADPGIRQHGSEERKPS